MDGVWSAAHKDARSRFQITLESRGHFRLFEFQQNDLHFDIVYLTHHQSPAAHDRIDAQKKITRSRLHQKRFRKNIDWPYYPGQQG
jgi:hypothetical protein